MCDYRAILIKIATNMYDTCLYQGSLCVIIGQFCGDCNAYAITHILLPYQDSFHHLGQQNYRER